jgi:hypothetical protein
MQISLSESANRRPPDKLAGYANGYPALLAPRCPAALAYRFDDLCTWCLTGSLADRAILLDANAFAVVAE